MSDKTIRQPERYLLQPYYVDAMQWNPGDLVQAGVLVGWLMSLGVDFRHPGGQGETTLLQVGDLKPISPGGWVLRADVDDRVFTLTDEQFRASYWRAAGGAS